MTAALAAAACVVPAVWLAWPSRSAAVRSRLGVRPRGVARAGWASVALGAAVIYAAGSVTAALAGVVVGAGWFVRCRVADQRRRRAHRRRVDEAAEAVDALAGELAAGAAPAVALARVSRDASVLDRARRAAELDGDVPRALRSQSPALAPLHDLAAAWQVAERTGAPLVDVLEGIAAHLASERDTRRQIVASLGPARATGHTLAFLPVFGVALGTAMGHAPLTFVTQTFVGVVLLAFGTALACLGVWWMDRLVDAAEDAP